MNESEAHKHIENAKYEHGTSAGHYNKAKLVLERKHEVAKKMRRADKVGSRKQDFSGGRQGNFMKVHKLDR